MGDRSEDMTDIIGRHYLAVTGVTRRNGTRPSPLNWIMKADMRLFRFAQIVFMFNLESGGEDSGF